MNFGLGGFDRLTIVVKNIIIINVLAVLVGFVTYKNWGINLNDLGGLHYWEAPGFHWWQLVTHMFLHGDPSSISETFWHIFFNMFALWMFGPILENMWGAKKFLLFYMVCGVGAGLCHLGVLTFEFNYLHHQMIDIIAVGASGAIFGILFAFVFLFPNALLYVYFAIPVKAKWFVAIYAGIELFSGVRNSAGDNVAHFAHLGGMLFAFILLMIWKRKRPKNIYK